MKPNIRISTVEGQRARGFSLVKLVIAVAVILVISAFALPSLTRTVRIYQLNDAAVRLAGVLKFTRFEAIRRNSPMNCVNAQGDANEPASVWSDDNGDPSRTALRESATAVGAGTLTAANPSSDNVRFDQRGGA